MTDAPLAIQPARAALRCAPIIAAAVTVAALLALPLLDSPFLVTQFTRVLIYAVFAMSLDLLIGYCGLVSLGHAAFFGVAAYVTALLTSEAGIESLWITLPTSVAAAALAAAVIGVLSLRTSGIYFIMVTLAFAQMIYFVVQENAFFGGSDGILLLTRFRVGIGDITLLDLGNSVTRYYVVLVVAVAVFAGLWFLVRSPFGRVIQGIRANEQRMRALGYPVMRYKFVCFVIAGALAGLAGHFYVVLTSLADPSIVDWLHSVQVLVMLIVGGIGTLIGPAVGAFALIVLTDQASELTEHWKLVVGALVIAITLFSRHGMVGLAQKIGARLFGRTST
jgi:branched-chain amino acid transport system permease protein